jgi:ABC-2 type transport system permease protein
MDTLVSQVKLETKLWFRQKETVFWTFAFPVFFMFLFGLIWKDDTWNNMPAINYLLPGIIVMALMTTCIVATATGLVEEREKGIFRRLSLTPLKRHILIGGQITNRYLVVLVQAALLITIGVGFFEARICGNLLLFWAILTLGAICFLSIGFALTGLIKSAKSAHPLAMIIFFILMFLGECFLPLDVMPDFLLPICSALPSAQMSETLRQVAIGGAGLGEVWQELLVPVGWLVGCSVLAVKFFKWE